MKEHEILHKKSSIDFLHEIDSFHGNCNKEM